MTRPREAAIAARRTKGRPLAEIVEAGAARFDERPRYRASVEARAELQSAELQSAEDRAIAARQAQTRAAFGSLIDEQPLRAPVRLVPVAITMVEGQELRATIGAIEVRGRSFSGGWLAGAFSQTGRLLCDATGAMPDDAVREVRAKLEELYAEIGESLEVGS